MAKLDIDELERHPLNGEDATDFVYWSERQDDIIAALRLGEQNLQNFNDQLKQYSDLANFWRKREKALRKFVQEEVDLDVIYINGYWTYRNKWSLGIS